MGSRQIGSFPPNRDKQQKKTVWNQQLGSITLATHSMRQISTHLSPLVIQSHNSCMHDDICWYGSIHKTNITVSCCYLVVTMEILIDPLNPWESWIRVSLLGCPSLHYWSINSPTTHQMNMPQMMRTSAELNLDSNLCKGHQISRSSQVLPVKSVEFPTFRFLWSSTSSRQPNGPRTSGYSTHFKYNPSTEGRTLSLSRLEAPT